MPKAKTADKWYNSKFAYSLGTAIVTLVTSMGANDMMRPISFRQRIADEIGVHKDEVPAIVSGALEKAESKIYIFRDGNKFRYHHYNGQNYDVRFSESGWPYFYNNQNKWQQCFTNKSPVLNP